MRLVVAIHIALLALNLLFFGVNQSNKTELTAHTLHTEEAKAIVEELLTLMQQQKRKVDSALSKSTLSERPIDTFTCSDKIRIMRAEVENGSFYLSTEMVGAANEIEVVDAIDGAEGYEEDSQPDLEGYGSLAEFELANAAPDSALLKPMKPKERKALAILCGHAGDISTLNQLGQFTDYVTEVYHAMRSARMCNVQEHAQTRESPTGEILQ